MAKYLKFLSFILLSFSGVFFLCRSANATSLTGQTGDMWIDGITYERGIYGTTSWSSNTVSPPVLTNQLEWIFSINGFSAGNELSRLYIAYKSGPSKAALIAFNISYTIFSPNTAFIPIYNGLSFKQTTVLINDSCINEAGVPMSESTANTYTFQCSYLVYIPAGRRSIDTQAGTPIFSAAGQSNNMTLRISSANYVELTNDGLSADDRAWLQQNLPDGVSQADIESAIEDARDDEKGEYEDQAEENETTINSDSSAAQSTATSLLGVVGQFISTLTSAQPTNCNLDGSLIPHLNLGNLNLCTYQMPTALTVLGSLVLIAFVVPLAYHTVKRMLALIGSFQS